MYQAKRFDDWFILEVARSGDWLSIRAYRRSQAPGKPGHYASGGYNLAERRYSTTNAWRHAERSMDLAALEAWLLELA